MKLSLILWYNSNKNEVIKMVQCYRKRIQQLQLYEPKNILKHKHNHCLKYLLIVTNINKHATGCYFNTKDYYYVLKCDQCDSFIPYSINGKSYSHILDDVIINNNKLPVITANTTEKCPCYVFSWLIDVVVHSK